MKHHREHPTNNQVKQWNQTRKPGKERDVHRQKSPCKQNGKTPQQRNEKPYIKNPIHGRDGSQHEKHRSEPIQKWSESTILQTVIMIFYWSKQCPFRLFQQHLPWLVGESMYMRDMLKIMRLQNHHLFSS